VPVAVLPLLSVAVHVIVVVPTGNESGALLVTLATPQLSDVPGVPRDTSVAWHVSVSAFTVTFPGVVIVGLSASMTVTA